MSECILRRVRAIASLAALTMLAAGWSFFDPFHAHVEKGNKLAKEGDAPSAVSEYDEAARANPASPIPDFNAGVAHARKGDTEAARSALLAAAASEDPAIAADALYNLGNVFLSAKQPQEAVNSYLRSLDLDPHDADARRNLEIALREQQMQQQQQQQQPQEQDPEQDEQEQEEQQPDDSQEPQEPQPQPEQPDSSAADSTQVPEEERLSREDAERLLNAIQSDEMKLLEQLQKKEPVREGVTNDW